MRCKCGYEGPIEMFRKDGKKCKKCHSTYALKNKHKWKKEEPEDITKDDYFTDLCKRMNITNPIKLLTKNR